MARSLLSFEVMILVLRRVLLWVLTTAIPVFIAACYGVPYSFARAVGRVTDARSGAGIEGIEVTCLTDGAVQATTLTGPSGSFALDYDESMPCDVIAAEDVDGADNGSYVSASVPFHAGQIGIALVPQD